MIYGDFALIYDMYAEVFDYDLWFSYLSRISGVGVEGKSRFAGKRTLDLGCGTGELVRRFNDAGADAWGVDASEGMLTLADAKFPSRRGGVHLINADMVAFEADVTFDFIYSACDSINYLDEERLAVLLKHVKGMLAPGSVFTFDSLNRDFFDSVNLSESVLMGEGLLSMKRRILQDRILETEVGYHCSELDFTEMHVQYFHSIDAVRSLASDAGFLSVSFWDIYTFVKSRGKTEKTQFALYA
jgi:SAM-dependent methyltransferase